MSGSCKGCSFWIDWASAGGPCCPGAYLIVAKKRVATLDADQAALAAAAQRQLAAPDYRRSRSQQVYPVKVVEVFTDGACRGNPGPGGWGVLLRYDGHEKTLHGGEPHTTNNRMELIAAIMGLEALKRRARYV